VGTNVGYFLVLGEPATGFFGLVSYNHTSATMALSPPEVNPYRRVCPIRRTMAAEALASRKTDFGWFAV
jgi:hypothetical protein